LNLKIRCIIYNFINNFWYLYRSKIYPFLFSLNLNITGRLNHIFYHHVGIHNFANWSIYICMSFHVVTCLKTEQGTLYCQINTKVLNNKACLLFSLPQFKSNNQSEGLSKIFLCFFFRKAFKDFEQHQNLFSHSPPKNVLPLGTNTPFKRTRVRINRTQWRKRDEKRKYNRLGQSFKRRIKTHIF
jgi:hypothetical protein